MWKSPRIRGLAAASLLAAVALAMSIPAAPAQLKFNLLQCGLKDFEGSILGAKRLWLKNTRSEVLKKGTQVNIRLVYTFKSSGNPFHKETTYTLQKYLHPGHTIELGNRMVLDAWEYKNCVAWPLKPTRRMR